MVADGPFTTTFCILELYHQLVNCLYGKEKFSKSRLNKRRGFGLHEEYFSQGIALSSVGLKLTYPLLHQFCTYISGKQRRQSFTLILGCLYYKELISLPNEIASPEFVKRLSNMIQTNLISLSDERVLDIEYGAVSFKQFLDIYCRKYRRNLMKTTAAQVFYELYIDSKELQEELCNVNTELFLVHSSQFWMFQSRNMNSALTSLKQWLKLLHFEELSSLWYQYAIKKMAVSDKDHMGLSTIDTLLTLSCQDIQLSYGINIRPAYIEPDTVSR
jgi:hypothetical protein